MGEDVRLALDILSDILQHSVFDPAELEREREVIIQEIGQSEDTPDDIIFDHLQETAYPAQSLGRPILGSVERVTNMGRADLQGFMGRRSEDTRLHSSHYRASRMPSSAC